MANNIRALRLKKGVSLKEMADDLQTEIEKSGVNVKPVSYATLSRWESGTNEPKLEMWGILAKYFSVPVSYVQGTSTNTQNIYNVVSASDKDIRQIADELNISYSHVLDSNMNMNFDNLTYADKEALAKYFGQTISYLFTPKVDIQKALDEIPDYLDTPKGYNKLKSQLFILFQSMDERITTLEDWVDTLETDLDQLSTDYHNEHDRGDYDDWGD
jgi:transcriptional regulator with XRE-family HTH domain